MGSKLVFFIRGTLNTFFYFDDGRPLKDFNNAFNVGDKAAFLEDFLPAYTETSFNDFKAFIDVSLLGK